MDRHFYREVVDWRFFSTVKRCLRKRQRRRANNGKYKSSILAGQWIGAVSKRKTYFEMNLGLNELDIAIVYPTGNAKKNCAIGGYKWKIKFNHKLNGFLNDKTLSPDLKNLDR
jgi:hypothetical protein